MNSNTIRFTYGSPPPPKKNVFWVGWLIPKQCPNLSKPPKITLKVAFSTRISPFVLPNLTKNPGVGGYYPLGKHIWERFPPQKLVSSSSFFLGGGAPLDCCFSSSFSSSSSSPPPLWIFFITIITTNIITMLKMLQYAVQARGDWAVSCLCIVISSFPSIMTQYYLTQHCITIILQCIEYNALYNFMIFVNISLNHDTMVATW